jgi:hypothetical protein
MVESSAFDPGRPDLREAAETLEQALTEACASRSAHEADTGELIRVEEMLALASEAARRAISIRRKSRLESGAPDVAPGTGELDTPVEGTLDSTRRPGAELSDQLTTATHRFIDDARGVRWDVWAVYPEGRPSQLSALPGSFQAGWLVFESASEKRRLSPIPAGWLTLPTVELQQLCEQAATAQRRSRPRGAAGEDKPTPAD